MTNDYSEAKALDKQHNFYMDQKDFFAEFMFNPAIKEGTDFNHLDKNLSTTRLSSKYQEPEMARALLTALHILNNQKYYVSEDVKVLDKVERFEQYEQVCDCGVKHLSDEITPKCSACGAVFGEESARIVMLEQPVYITKTVRKSIYPKIYHKLKSAFYSLTTTAAAREGHLMRAATSTHLIREDSVEERTDSRKQHGFVRNPVAKTRY